MSIEELKKILDSHKLWIESKAKEGGKAHLEGANLEGADLYGADLRRADLHGANLRGADLRRADLYGANLRGADLYGANLRGANLEGADLYGANLEGADLRRADLYVAYLEGANLEGADLRGANLEGANLEGANLEGTNLEGTNLHKAYYTAPAFRLDTGKWSISFNGMSLQIGCQTHPIEAWEKFTDAQISSMGPQALEFWRAHKKWVLGLAKSLQAKRGGVEEEAHEAYNPTLREATNE